MFIFLLVLALFALIGLIVFMLIELNSIEHDGLQFIAMIKRRYGDE